MPSLSVKSLADALTDSLRTRIINGELSASDAVTEASLATYYDVARPTAKSAIERLVHEGLLERTAHKSARVPLMDIARIKDMYFARKLVECQAYRLLAEQRQLPAEALAANENLRHAAGAGALGELVESDVRFHRSLIAGLDSPRITKAHGALINEMRLCLVQVQAHQLLDPRVIAEEHMLIVNAIRDGDGDLADQRGCEHLDHAESQLVSYLSRESE